jgi:hypothetical protein
MAGLCFSALLLLTGSPVFLLDDVDYLMGLTKNGSKHVMD